MSDKYLGNVEVAIMTSLNELAVRHGLSPLDINAAFYPQGDKSHLTFYRLAGIPIGKLERMLTALGTDHETLLIEGSPQEIYDTIQRAIEKAPMRTR